MNIIKLCGLGSTNIAKVTYHIISNCRLSHINTGPVCLLGVSAYVMIIDTES